MTKTIHALIVGINAYPAHPLYGCVNDALAVGSFFKEFCDNPDNGLNWAPQYLLAPHPEDMAAIAAAASEDPSIAGHKKPSREAFIKTFTDHLCSSRIKPDDICLFYYSGHGAQELAAPEFAHIETDGMNQTFVLLDSRETGNRDLLDKELAWLLSQVKNKIPDGHLLVVTDSCFSGNSTRDSGSSVRERRERARDTATPYLEILGVKDVEASARIFQLLDNKAFYIKESAHIQLAASRENETSKETAIGGKQHGIFTWNLLRVLRQGGAALNYTEIMRRTETFVRSMVSNQLPQLSAWGGAQKSENFLGAAYAPARTEYLIEFQKGQWRLKAGALNGVVVDTSGKSKTLVRLTKGREVEVTAVYSNYSLLDPGKFTQLSDKANAVHEERAVFLQMPNSSISVFVDPASIQGEKLSKLQEAIAAANCSYCDFGGQSVEGADYAAQLDGSGKYMLVRKGSNYPVFKRQIQPGQFVAFCNNVGRARFVQEMGKSSIQGLSREDIEVKFEILENVDNATINITKGMPVSAEAIVLHYHPGNDSAAPKIPALRCSVQLKKKGFWVGGLYLDNEFGIYPLLEVKQDLNGEKRQFEVTNEGATYNAIPLYIDPIRLKQGVGETTESIKVFISSAAFNLADFEQEPLPLDEETTRKSIGFGPGSQAPPDWMVLTFPVTIKAVSERVALKSLSGLGFSVVGLPDGFSAQAAMSSLSEIERKLLKIKSRGFELLAEPPVLPPASLWGDAPQESVVFSKNFEANSSQALSVLELTDVTGPLEQPFFLDLEESCSDDEVIVAFGYHKEMDGFVPLGISTGNRQIEVVAMPTETPGIIADEEAGLSDKGLKSSLKMFFKKLVRKQNPNTLALVNKDLNRETDISKIRSAVGAAKNILMVTPGWLGDTEKIAAAVMKLTRIHESYEVVLAYDYENLNTPLADTAKDLHRRLLDAGVFAPGSGRRLTILASSTGGVMCRWMLEQDKNGVDFVRKLFLVAVPNLGTDLSPFRKRLFGLIGKALSGVSAIKPYLLPLSILAKKTGKEMWVTLNQLDPKSEFLLLLNHKASLPPAIQRSSIGGTVKNLRLNRNNSGGFWKRMKRFALKTFLDWAVFEGEHDMVNPVKSQKGAPWFKPGDIVILDVDHLSYYYEEASLKAIEKALTIGPKAGA